MILFKKSLVAAVLFVGIIFAFFIFITISTDIALAQSIVPKAW